jgi:hypothetical protein
MRDIPDAADLLATARDTLVNELLPLLPREQRYTGLMIANCLAVAAREQEKRSDAEDDELSGLRMLLNESGVARARADDAAAEHDTTRGRDGTGGNDSTPMYDAIRAGSFDTGLRLPVLRAHLSKTASAWVAISNPKALRTDAPAVGVDDASRQAP